MTTSSPNEPWRIELQQLIDKARKEGKWLWCNYQDIWFKPEELEAQHAKGSYLWGAQNWKLRNPQEYLQEAEIRLKQAVDERNRIAERIK